MENISGIKQKQRYPLQLKIDPYLFDHYLEGKTIFPAVEALIVLAKTVKQHFPNTNINRLQNARFPRFLTIESQIKNIDVFVELVGGGAGTIVASLTTAVKIKAGNITRMMEHAYVEFNYTDNRDSISAHPFRSLEKLSGKCINVPADSVYRELVPFGLAYQNIIGDLSLSADGALAYLSGGKCEVDDDILGSPFPFDAAMHAACVWTQRFTGVVPFPVGFQKRMIYKKTMSGGNYLARIVPMKYDTEPFTFNIWIFDLSGNICEAIEGLQMRDVSQGKRKPPAWIKETAS
jgi:hypothetical protein